MKAGLGTKAMRTRQGISELGMLRSRAVSCVFQSCSPSVVEHCSSGSLVLTDFGIAEDDLCGHIYFLLIHVWLVHRRLVALVSRDSIRVSS